MPTIIPHPINSGKMLPMILMGERRISKNMVIKCSESIQSFVRVRATNIVWNPNCDEISIVGIVTIEKSDDSITDMCGLFIAK